MSVPPNLLSNPSTMAAQATLCLNTEHYAAAATLYEQLVEIDPEEITHRWQLGLAYLLQGNETEAQMTWAFALMNGEPEQVAQWIAQLHDLLEQSAQQQEQQQHLQLAWMIRQHIQELVPTNIINLFSSLKLALELGHLPEDELQNSGLIETLQDQSLLELSIDIFSDKTLSAFLLAEIEHILTPGIPSPALIKVINACIPHIRNIPALIELLLPQADYFATVKRIPLFACHLAEIILTIDSYHPLAYRLLINSYAATQEHQRLLELVHQYRNRCQTPLEKILGNSCLLLALLRNANAWEDLAVIGKQQQALITTWLNEIQADPTQAIDWGMLRQSFYFFLFLGDHPEQVRPLQNRVMQSCHQHLNAQFDHYRGKGSLYQSFAPRQPRQRPLKVGYLAKYMCRHSVGWLARWLIQHHDRDRVEISTYHISHTQVNPFMQRWYVDPVSRSLCLHGNALEIAEALYQEDLDILVELDSLTFDLTFDVMLHKPAPIQVSWLGMDAPGSPAIDYYIADPHVLPETAQSYYAEEIWRLPHTYIAVDGFEIDVPTLRRDDLGIPEDAVIYLSAQSSQKRYPETIRLQLQIIKTVPNSFFLIKGLGNAADVQQLFLTLAAEVGVEGDRLKFLPRDASEEIHRANLGIADVVLDTFPYNGATTTLETLWMGIPIVTKVGQQFAARNSYTMMINAGIEEGIAWTDEDYVAWGIRLGSDAALRQQIAEQLKRSRQTAPLWNTQQFARDMERAYEEMWQRYLHSVHP